LAEQEVLKTSLVLSSLPAAKTRRSDRNESPPGQRKRFGGKPAAKRSTATSEANGKLSNGDSRCTNGCTRQVSPFSPGGSSRAITSLSISASLLIGLARMRPSFGANILNDARLISPSAKIHNAGAQAPCSSRTSIRAHPTSTETNCAAGQDQVMRLRQAALRRTEAELAYLSRYTHRVDTANTVSSVSLQI
jgi:hypothetical protein